MGEHSETINALHLNYVAESAAEIVTLDEAGVVKVHRPDGTCLQIELSA